MMNDVCIRVRPLNHPDSLITTVMGMIVEA